MLTSKFFHNRPEPKVRGTPHFGVNFLHSTSFMIETFYYRSFSNKKKTTDNIVALSLIHSYLLPIRFLKSIIMIYYLLHTSHQLISILLHLAITFSHLV